MSRKKKKPKRCPYCGADIAYCDEYRFMCGAKIELSGPYLSIFRLLSVMER